MSALLLTLPLGKYFGFDEIWDDATAVEGLRRVCDEGCGEAGGSDGGGGGSAGEGSGETYWRNSAHEISRDSM